MLAIWFAGKVFAEASNMLKIALEAKDSKQKQNYSN